MKINYKRSLKFVTLLISALLIGTVSATMYNYMYMYATPIGVKSTYDVNFYAGSDTSPAGGTITNNLQTVTFTGMKGSNGTLATYTDAVRICNNATGARSVEVTKDSWTGDTVADLNYVNITLYDSSSGFIGCMSLVPGGKGSGGNSTTGAYNLAGTNAWWRVQWDIFWFANATTSDSVSANLKIIVHD
jgi:hypothetical protein